MVASDSSSIRTVGVQNVNVADGLSKIYITDTRSHAPKSDLALAQCWPTMTFHLQSIPRFMLSLAPYAKSLVPVDAMTVGRAMRRFLALSMNEAHRHIILPSPELPSGTTFHPSWILVPLAAE